MELVITEVPAVLCQICFSTSLPASEASVFKDPIIWVDFDLSLEDSAIEGQYWEVFAIVTIRLAIPSFVLLADLVEVIKVQSIEEL